MQLAIILMAKNLYIIVRRSSAVLLKNRTLRTLTAETFCYVKMATDVGKKQVKTLPKNASKSNEEIIQGFQRLRTEQRQLANKLSELEMDLNEHK